MPKYRIIAPDGKTYDVNAPDGASQDDVLAYVQQNYQGAAAQSSQPKYSSEDLSKAYYQAQAAGDEQSKQSIFRQLRQQGGTLRSPTQEEIQASSKTVGSPLGTDGQNYASGMGKSVIDNLRGMQQIGAGLVSNLPFIGDHAQAAYDRMKQEQGAANVTDAPLMSTKAGVLGNISGQALQAIAGGTALKGAGLAGQVMPTGYAGAMLSGAAQGAIQPLSADQSEWSRLGNAAIGAGAGAAGQGLVNGLGATYRGAKALLSPFFDRGQEQIAANTLSRFGGDAAKMATPSQVPGVNASLAEQTGNAGIAQLQRAILDSDPAIMQRFTQQQANNNAARLGLLQQAAGTSDQLESAIARRDNVAQQLYQQAFQDSNSQQVARQWSAQKLAEEGAQAAQDAKAFGLGSQNPRGILSDALNSADKVLQPSDRMVDLAQRPIMQRAIATAKTIASNQGRDIGDPMASLEGQHYVKLALDDALNVASQQGIGKSEQSAIASTKSAFVNELERQNPAYGAARQTYRDMSGPVNQIQLGQGLLGRVTSPQAGEFGQIVDALGNPVLTPDGFGNAVKQLDSIAKQVTGQKNASAASILGTQQKDAITSLLGDLSRVKVANNTGKSLGSNTVQNLASQNLLSEVGNGLGLPALADSGLLGRLATPASKVYGLFGIPDQIKEKLAQVVLNPQSAEAQAIIRRMTPAQRSAFAQYAASTGGLIGQASGLGISQKPALQP